MRDDFTLSNDRDGTAPLGMGVASQIVALLSARSGTDGAFVRSDLSMQLESASFDDDPDAIVRVLGQFRRMRISAAAIADHYIPEAARSLGQGWVDDRLTFAEVSQGAVRLQRLLRDFSGQWTADGAKVPDVGQILLIVPEGEQHTLGAMVVTGQMRRRGVSVCLRFGPSRDEMAALHFARRFDGVFISLSCTDKLAQCRNIVASVKSFAGTDLPVVVGGPVVGMSDDVASVCGADAATNDLELALSSCGLVTEDQTARRSA
jgi:MerR family transcriptional regulator, light-induced transcriptional regulator